MKAIDLTLRLKKDNPFYQRLSKNMKSVWDRGHVGTHVDIMNSNDIPLEYRKSSGKIFNVSHLSKDQEINISSINTDLIEENDFVLFRTGYINEINYGENDYFKSLHPLLSHALIDLLISKKVRFIGIDAPGVRRGREHAVADQKCADNGIYIVENMVNLEKIKNNNHLNILCLWFYQERMTGIPCRVIAEYNH